MEIHLKFHRGAGESGVKVIQSPSPGGSFCKGSFTTFTTYTKEGNEEAAASKVEEIEL